MDPDHEIRRAASTPWKFCVDVTTISFRGQRLKKALSTVARTSSLPLKHEAYSTSIYANCIERQIHIPKER